MLGSLPDLVDLWRLTSHSSAAVLVFPFREQRCLGASCLELRQQPDLSAIVAKAARAPHRVVDCKVSIFQYRESQDVPGKVVMIRPACGN